MPTKTQAYNPFDYFTEEEAAEFLAEAYEKEEPEIFIQALSYAIQHQGVANIAKATGLNRESLYKVVRGTAEPKWSTVHKVLKALHINLTVAA